MPSLSDLYEEGEREDAVLGKGEGFVPICADSALCAAIERLASKFGVGDDGGWEAQLKLALAAASKMVEIPNGLVEAIRRTVSLCESPIERRVFPWLALQRHWLFEYPSLVANYDLKNMSQFSLAIVPQLPIGGYRVDFAFVGRLDGLTKAVVVECDGEAFHQDVEVDERRTEALLRTGKVLSVLRLTGKEIYRDPKTCAHVVTSSVHSAWNKLRLDDNKQS